MSENESNVVEFTSNRPGIRIKKQDFGANSACPHRQLVIDSDTQLVECQSCRAKMSAFTALKQITREWESRQYEVDEWRKMKTEQAVVAKADQVKRKIRELQWIGPPEDDPEAADVWSRVTEATGKEPYAMFRRGRGKSIQYCLLSETGGWTDAECAIGYAKQRSMAVITRGDQSGRKS